jgi:hypothetical protein
MFSTLVREILEKKVPEIRSCRVCPPSDRTVNSGAKESTNPLHQLSPKNWYKGICDFTFQPLFAVVGSLMTG